MAARERFAVGHSNGAMMTVRLACEAADVFTAVVPVTGSLEINRCTPAKAVAVLAMHGDADRNLRSTEAPVIARSPMS